MSENKQRRPKDFIDDRAARGRYHFDASDMRQSLGVSAASTNNALSRLAHQGLIASPAKGFYVIVPPEYRSLGCLPAEQFIPALFDRKAEPYYAGLLTAAQYYGAAHQRPQAFQVVVGKSRKDIKCGSVKVTFIANKSVDTVPTRLFNTPRGTLKVSTPEATLLDLIEYSGRAGGLDMIATVIAGLAEEVEPDELARLSWAAPISRVQRLGHLLDHVDQFDVSQPLLVIVAEKARDYTPLAPSRSHESSAKDDRWKIYVNASVEIDE
ncbi:type IV toxin-antitoxin system AbiEi family antitoxin [Nitratireductor sp. XY-223]|uniref:type IV toxin-antitoxin system AbiEi family antitoxin n=1 Tax=Nitratireductor sp. XY-223 TaxID=2561926 RepID=UPI0010AA5FCD|nr:type IV toxin-antitoxin system AbiEi family antitoxin [Nitratireductor sp. XY-223]